MSSDRNTVQNIHALTNTLVRYISLYLTTLVIPLGLSLHKHPLRRIMRLAQMDHPSVGVRSYVNKRNRLHLNQSRETLD